MSPFWLIIRKFCISTPHGMIRFSLYNKVVDDGDGRKRVCNFGQKKWFRELPSKNVNCKFQKVPFTSKLFIIGIRYQLFVAVSLYRLWLVWERSGGKEELNPFLKPTKLDFLLQLISVSWRTEPEPENVILLEMRRPARVRTWEDWQEKVLSFNYENNIVD